eukprot:Phypoly_transcript_00875.p1 GENE.Phypoly_transcript_00875~~Phypoly_transcript_00875.p1  ORF type:complete len:573 (+),score=87.23 Phypoly_transcript_00875:2176-3894(+)
MVNPKVVQVLILVLLANITCSLPVYDVRSYGAKGDGITDDRLALIAAVDAVKSVSGNAILYFSAGTYRIGRGIEPGQVAGAIEFIGVPQVNIQFEDGATLLMDNLDPSGYGDQLSGIYIAGPTDAVQITKPNIRWKTKPTARSQGCGIAMRGFPEISSGQPYITNVVVDHPTIQWAPQAGIIFMGVSDPHTISPILIETLADGIHHNACLRPKVTGGVTGTSLGDDVCPFFTYYTPVRGQGIYGGNEPYEPYGMPDLEEWSNSGGFVDFVQAQNGEANAVRIDGGLNITIGTIFAHGTKFALTTDAAIKTAGYTDWTVQVSRGINVGKIVADSCYVSVLGICQYVNKSSDGPNFYAADIHIGTVYSTNSSSWPLQISGMEGITIDDVIVDGTVLIQNDAANIHIGSLTAIELNVDIARNIKIDQITAQTAEFTQVSGIAGKSWYLSNSPATSLSFANAQHATVAAVRIDNPNRSGSQGARALLFACAQDFTIGYALIATDAQPLAASCEFGGGTSAGITQGVTIGFMQYLRTSGPNSSDVVFQGGPYAPENIKYYMIFSSDGGKTWAQESHA